MSNNYISIIMPVKNVEKYINLCIDSILNQTLKNFELIILDDSNDRTSDIIDNYTDNRIKHIYFKGNISQKLNYGVNTAASEYICRMDGDDIAHPRKLEKQLDFISKNSNIDILGTNFSYIDKFGNQIANKTFPEKDKDIKFMMPVITSVLHSTVMLKRDILIKEGGYDENLHIAEDTELFIRILDKYRFYNLQKYLYFYRINHKIAIKESNNIGYKIGLNYLNNKLRLNVNKNETMFQIALLEYYRGDIKKSRSILKKIIWTSNISKTKIFRYLIPTMLGKTLFSMLRDFGFFSRLNRILLKTTNYDSNIIK